MITLMPRKQTNLQSSATVLPNCKTNAHCLQKYVFHMVTLILKNNYSKWVKGFGTNSQKTGLVSEQMGESSFRGNLPEIC